MMRQPPGSEATLGDRIFATFQSLLPTRALSAFMFRVAQVRSKPFKNALMRWFLHKYAVDLEEAEWSRVDNYEHFNAFFTRALKPGLRPQPAAANILSSPVDGAISQVGPIRQGQIFQAKGHSYSAAALLADEEMAKNFYGGSFSTIYLAPHDYHRVHMPCTGRLRSWAYVPGRLFSVNPSTARSVPGLFARNERMVAIFDTQFGPLALVMVGAIIVGGIETVWSGQLTPPHLRNVPPTYYQPMQPLTLPRGAELGRFHMGSTVILLAPPGVLTWDPALTAGQEVRLGQSLATMLK
ncbi:MAG: phosphatidylserine decarboxylase [Nevskia sp.]|nr:phosphatidylserine decarboxylase [Nevskia sp.]